jgi:hypothetical protein
MGIIDCDIEVLLKCPGPSQFLLLLPERFETGANFTCVQTRKPFLIPGPE